MAKYDRNEEFDWRQVEMRETREIEKRKVRVLFSRDYDYCICQANGPLLISVYFSTRVGDFSKEYRLSSEEAKQSFESLVSLANDIRSNPNKYEKRRVDLGPVEFDYSNVTKI